MLKLVRLCEVCHLPTVSNSLRPTVKMLDSIDIRGLQTSGSCNAMKNSVAVFRSARVMKKLITGSSRNKRKFFNVDQPVSKSFMEFGALSGKGQGGSFEGGPKKSNRSIRRVEVLNALFMEHITGLMATGEASTDLLGYGITVSMVKMSNDFSKVNVYWIATGTDTDERIEPVLKNVAGHIRHELTQLRIIGIVPPIEFIKDKTYSKVMEVQTLLDKCDLGDDFIPTPGKDLFSQSQGNRTKGVVEDDRRRTGSDLENTFETDLLLASTETELYQRVSMRQDMLGLRHDVIMNDLKQMVTRIQKKHKPQGDPLLLSSESLDLLLVKGSESSTSSINDEGKSTVELANEHKQRMNEFMVYLRKRQISKGKQLKRENTAKERDFYENEAFMRWKSQFEDAEIVDDYLDDEMTEQQADRFYSQWESSRSDSFETEDRVS